MTALAIKKSPLPLFDTAQYLESHDNLTRMDVLYPNDYRVALSFLSAYKHTTTTFNAYRREIERLLHWSWTMGGHSILTLRRIDIEAFIAFCLNPPKRWVGQSTPPRFLEKAGNRLPNPKWRPFVSVKSNDTQTPYRMSPAGIKDCLAILSTFYNFLIQENVTEINPVIQVRQKNRFIQSVQTERQVRRLSKTQWQTVFDMAKTLATQNPAKHERTLFILTTLYSLYLRISEVVAIDRWTPLMSHFSRDYNDKWWFTTVGKGNKKREIAVSDTMLAALKRWRLYLGLSPLPSPADNSPLFLRLNLKGPITSTYHVRRIVKVCFDKAVRQLEKQQLPEEAASLKDATVHWLRHTGISEDVKTRPREHVRDDAGHGSGAVTDRYIDIERAERHQSAENKTLDLETDAQ